MSPRTTLAVLAVTIAWLAGVASDSRANDEGPYRITPAEPSAPASVSGPVSILRWADDAERLTIGTLDGSVELWRLSPKNGKVLVGSRERFAADGLATFALAGRRHDLHFAGFAANPGATSLAGAKVGRFDVDVARLAEPDYVSGRVALAHGDRLTVFSFDGSPSTPVALRPDFLGWTHGPSGPRLVCSVDQGRKLAFVRFREAVPPEQSPEIITVQPPILYPEGDAAPIPVTLLCGAAHGDDEIVTGDSSGRLRVWNVPQPPDDQALSTASVAAYSPDGETLVDFGDRTLTRRGASPLTGLRDAVPTSLACGGASTFYAVIAWPSDDQGRVEVERFDLAGEELVLSPDREPTDEIVALDIDPASGEVVGAVAGQGAIFFREPPAEEDDTDEEVEPEDGEEDQEAEDPAIVAIRYVASGNRALAVGQKASLYEAETGNVLDSASLDAVATVCAFDFQNASLNAGRLLYGSNDGRIHVVPFEIVGDELQLGTTTSIRAAAGPIDTVGLRMDRAIVVANGAVTVWRTPKDGAQPPAPLETFDAAGPVRAGALRQNGVVRWRTPTHECRRTPAAGALRDCGDASVRQIASLDPTLVVASDDRARLFVSTATGVSSENSGSTRVASLAISPSGTMLAAGVAGNGPSSLRTWRIDNGALKDPRGYLDGRSAVIEILYGADDATMVVSHEGPTGGRISLLRSTPGREVEEDLRIDGEVGGTSQLAWRPGPPGSQDYDRLLGIEANGDFTLRRLTRSPGPAYQPNQPSLTRTPWYAAAIRPDGRGVAIADADGQAWEGPWPFPARISFAASEPQTVALAPVADHAPSASPLYGIGWSTNFDPGADPVLFVAGADGNFYRRTTGEWISQATMNPDQPVYALACHPRAAVLVLGHGDSGNPAVQEEAWLSVWPKDLAPDKARFWFGHGGPIRAVAFNADGSRLASVDRTGKLLVWDCGGVGDTAVEMPVPSRLDLGSDVPTSLAWLDPALPNVLAVGQASGSVRFLHVEPR